MSYLIKKQSIFDRNPVFDLIFNDSLLGLDRPNYNPYHINETEDAFELRIDCPGFDKSEININYENNVLSVSAKSEQEDQFRSEFSKAFEIPNVDIKKSTADLSNGVLLLTLKKVASAKNQQLKIK